MIKDSLYYADPYLADFSATALTCVEAKGGFEVVLSRTAFYPEGGGEPCDLGAIGGARVVRVCERGGAVVHLCDMRIETGAEVECKIDLPRRLRYMRLHTGEHIFTGALNALCGVQNVGFHMGDDAVIVDFDRELSPELLREAEDRANAAVLANLPVRCSFPAPQLLETKQYRLKKALSGDIRLVEIEGVDCCACCGLHVASTGEVGMIKAGGYMRYKGGCRITLYIASDALADYRIKQREVSAVSALTSAKPHEIAGAVGALLEREGALKAELSSLKARHYALLADNTPARSGIACIVDGDASPQDLRLLADCLKNARGRGAALAPYPGGCRFALSDRDGLCKRLCELVRAGGTVVKGGGDAHMIQGVVEADETRFVRVLEKASAEIGQV